ncbi:hypothetical protein, partial [Chromobacterium phragmitis]
RRTIRPGPEPVNTFCEKKRTFFDPPTQGIDLQEKRPKGIFMKTQNTYPWTVSKTVSVKQKPARIMDSSRFVYTY